ncbi:MAG TPA: DNA/RNA non-specific endonuclease [Gemmatimonadales bacterium]|nr:DNA/RNA non-specific endonuclease [Gemmatimonadales bacterium]
MRSKRWWVITLVAGGSACAGQMAQEAVRVAPRTALAAEQANFTEAELQLIAKHCPLGRPRLDPDFGHGPTRFVIREGFVLQHSSRDKIPLWVCEGISTAQLVGSLQRAEAFKPDPRLPAGERSELKDYRGSGYDRGHMAPAADQSVDEELKRETFFLSNMAPQKNNLNAQVWAALEAKARDWLLARGGGFIITGPIFYDPAEEDPATADGLINFFEIGPGKVAVPTHFYKLVVARSDAGELTGIGFVLEHRPYPRPFDFAPLIRTIDWIEQQTGIDFMPDLGAVNEGPMESTVPELWLP